MVKAALDGVLLDRSESLRYGSRDETAHPVRSPSQLARSGMDLGGVRNRGPLHCGVGIPRERFLVRVLIVAVAAATFVILGGCGRETTRGISVDRAFRPLIPPDTKVLRGAHIYKI